MTMVTANGVLMHCQTKAAPPERALGETVVFVHGIGTDSLASFYLTLAPPLAAAGIDVVTYDLRGHGRTERPENGYTLGDFVDDLDALLGALGVHDTGRPVHLVGNSFGGTIAFSYADRFPDKVASLVLIEAEPATEPWSGRMSEVLGNTVDFLIDEGNYPWIENMFGAHHRRLARNAAQLITSTTMVEEIPIGPLMSAADIAGLRCPVLSLLGDDGFQSRDLYALTSTLPDARVVVFPNQGHSVLVERHREVRELVIDWIGEHRTTTDAASAGGSASAGGTGQAWRAS